MLSPTVPCEAARGVHASFPRGHVHRLADLLVAGAAAEVAGESLADLLVARRGLALEQVDRRDEHPGCAEAALHGAGLDEGPLDSVELASGGERLHGSHRPAGGLDGGDEAGADDLAVEPDRAGTALALLARVLRADQAERVAEHGEKARRRGDGEFVPHAVDVEKDGCHAAHLSSIVQASARRERWSTTCLRYAGRAAQVVDRRGAGGREAAELMELVQGRRRGGIAPGNDRRAVGLGLDRAKHGRPDGAERHADAMALLVELQADAGDRDHHRVARPDLRERAGAGRALELDADDQLVGGEARVLGADQELIPGDAARAGAGRRNDDEGLVRREDGDAGPRRRGRCEVAADRRSGADLRRPDGAGGGVHECGQLRQLPDDPGEGHSSADEVRYRSACATDQARRPVRGRAARRT